MKKFIIKFGCYAILLLIVIELMSCHIIIFNKKGFDNKNELIKCVKNNIEELNLIVENLYTEYNGDKNYLTIEKKNSSVWANSIGADGIYDKIFDENLLRYIEFDAIHNKIIFCAYVNYQSTYCGFYYSKYDDMCLRETKNFITNGNWTIHFFQEKSGWYTEKICDNWYYYEEDWDQFNFINYIKDDLKNMKEYKEIYDRFREYFDE